MVFKRKTILSEKTVGKRLRDARRKQHLTLEQAEEATRVRAKYLAAIEKDQWNEFPSRVYVIGFVKSYSQYLGLDSKQIVEEYKRNFLEPQKIFTPSQPKEGILARLIITPKILFSVLVGIIIMSAIGYVGYSINRLSKPPQIEISSPKSDTSDEKTLLIEGKTDSTASVEINSQPINVDDAGHFSQTVELVSGVNFFDIKAKSRLGREATKVVKVLYEEKK